MSVEDERIRKKKFEMFMYVGTTEDFADENGKNFYFSKNEFTNKFVD